MLDPLDSSQHGEVEKSIKDIVDSAIDNGFTDMKLTTLRKIVGEHTDIFQTPLSSELPTDVPPLKNDLVSDATFVRLRLRNYSQDQKEFLSTMVSKFMACGMEYPRKDLRSSESL